MYLKFVGKNSLSRGTQSEQYVLPTQFSGTLPLIWHITENSE